MKFSATHMEDVDVTCNGRRVIILIILLVVFCCIDKILILVKV